MNATTYTGPNAAELAGITYKQLDYWARTELIRPSVLDARGSGSRRRYSQRDLFVLKTIKRLLDVGIRLEVIRELGGLLNDSPVDADIRLELAPGCTLVIEAERADLAELDAYVASRQEGATP